MKFRLEWAWKLESGEKVVARLDPAAQTEAVLVDGRVASETASYALPSGHRIDLDELPTSSTKSPFRTATAPRHAVVDFDDEEGARLWFDGTTHRPARTPSRIDRVLTKLGRARAFAVLAVVTLFALVQVWPLAPVQRAWSHLRWGPARAQSLVLPLNATHHAENENLTAHHPGAHTVVDTEGEVVVTNGDSLAFMVGTSPDDPRHSLGGGEWALRALAISADARHAPYWVSASNAESLVRTLQLSGVLVTRGVTAAASSDLCPAGAQQVQAYEGAVREHRVPMNVWACSFVQAGRTVVLGTVVPARVAYRDEELMLRVATATEPQGPAPTLHERARALGKDGLAERVLTYDPRSKIRLDQATLERPLLDDALAPCERGGRVLHVEIDGVIVRDLRPDAVPPEYHNIVNKLGIVALNFSLNGYNVRVSALPGETLRLGDTFLRTGPAADGLHGAWTGFRIDECTQDEFGTMRIADLRYEGAYTDSSRVAATAGFVMRCGEKNSAVRGCFRVRR